MSAPRCGWCLEVGHPIGLCPGVAKMSIPPVTSENEPRTDSEDAVDALRMRYVAQRTFSGQLLRLLREANVEIPIALLELNPDIYSDL